MPTTTARDIHRIAISTSGGDAPGLNAVIRGLTKAAILKYRWEVVGLLNGLEGLVDTTRVVPLGLDQVRGLLSRGGTVLGAASHGNPFSRSVVRNGQAVVEDLRPLLVKNFHYLGLDALVCIGGEGTMKIAAELGELGLPVVGVPKTIDNDLAGTELTFGFHTAVQTAMEALDRLQTTAASHHRVMILELMGRYAGWISLMAGIAGDADVILLPEIPFDLQEVVDAVLRRNRRGSSFSIIVVAEGAREKDGELHVMRHVTEGTYANERLGGIGDWLADKVHEQTGLECRSTVLGHIQRGGSPIAFDRILATKFGIKAAGMIAKGRFNHLAVLEGGEIIARPFSEVVGREKNVDPEGQTVRYAERMGVNFGRPNREVRI
ncbi:MAG: ATP-dependent 6-phosphofructokinase [bacterium]|nr:ATP-dependent 6-phosphofructokinase [bacterium]